MAELDDRGRDAADGLLAKVTAVARTEAARAVAEKLNNVVEGGRLNWDMLTQWGHRLLDNGTEVPIRPKLDLVGFTVADDPAGDLTRVTGGGGTALPRCAAYCSRDVGFNPASGTITQVPLDRDQYDPANWHDETTSSPYVILPAEGDYLVVAEFRPSLFSTNPRIPLQLWLYGGATGSAILGRDEDTYHQDDEHTGAWGSDSPRTLRIVYADHFAAGTHLNLRFRHFSGDTAVSFAYENELGPRLLVYRLDSASSGGSASTICHVYRSTDKNILAGTFTAVDFDGERTDPAGLHSPTVNPSRITFATNGRYRAVVTITWHISGGTEQYRAWLFLNGSILLAQADCNSSVVSDVGCTLTYEFDAAAGDYVELYVRHTATTDIFLVGDDVGDGSGDRGTELSVTAVTGNGETSGGAFVGCDAYDTGVTGYTINSGTHFVMPLDGEDFDTGGLHDLVTNNTRITAPADGYYHCAAQFMFNTFDVPGSGTYWPLHLWLYKNGTAMRQHVGYVVDGHFTMLHVEGTLHLVTGDYIELVVQQTTGGRLQPEQGNLARAARLTVVKVG